MQRTHIHAGIWMYAHVRSMSARILKTKYTHKHTDINT